MGLRVWFSCIIILLLPDSNLFFLIWRSRFWPQPRFVASSVLVVFQVTAPRRDSRFHVSFLYAYDVLLVYVCYVSFKCGRFSRNVDLTPCFGLLLLLIFAILLLQQSVCFCWGLQRKPVLALESLQARCSSWLTALSLSINLIKWFLRLS